MPGRRRRRGHYQRDAERPRVRMRRRPPARPRGGAICGIARTPRLHFHPSPSVGGSGRRHFRRAPFCVRVSNCRGCRPLGPGLWAGGVSTADRGERAPLGAAFCDLAVSPTLPAWRGEEDEEAEASSGVSAAREGWARAWGWPPRGEPAGCRRGSRAHAPRGRWGAPCGGASRFPAPRPARVPALGPLGLRSPALPPPFRPWWLCQGRSLPSPPRPRQADRLRRRARWFRV